MSTYVFDQAWQQERQRLGGLEALFDPATRRYLAERGLGPGWRCLEVGCGGGSVAVWLADQVGPEGCVLATDLDPRFLNGHGRENLDVRKHDLVADPLETEAFDLAHARAVVEHTQERERALAKLVAAVRPGGWVVVEDVDFGRTAQAALASHVSPPQHGPLFERFYAAGEALFERIGSDASFGPRLPAALAGAGLEHIGVEVHMPLVRGGPEPGWVPLTIAHLQAQLVGAGLLSAAEIRELLDLCADPSFRYPPPFMVTAWGQRPAP
jgi:SAM-dependent methyltransferase